MSSTRYYEFVFNPNQHDTGRQDIYVPHLS